MVQNFILSKQGGLIFLMDSIPSIYGSYIYGLNYINAPNNLGNKNSKFYLNRIKSSIKSIRKSHNFSNYDDKIVCFFKTYTQKYFCEAYIEELKDLFYLISKEKEKTLFDR